MVGCGYFVADNEVVRLADGKIASIPAVAYPLAVTCDELVAVAPSAALLRVKIADLAFQVQCLGAVQGRGAHPEEIVDRPEQRRILEELRRRLGLAIRSET